MTFIPTKTPAPRGADDARADFGPTTAEDLTKLAEVAFAAVENGRGAEAKPIFDMLIKAQPENAAGSVGMALVEYAEGSSAGAIQRLKNAARNCRVSVDEANATLAILLAMEGRRAEAAALKRELLRRPDSAAKQMVMGLHLE